MKKLLYLFLLLPVFLFAQPRYGVEGIPMCWTKNGVDSNVIRFVVISSTGSPTQTIAFENAAGQVVNVDDGFLRYGYCACSNESSGIPDGSVTWAKLADPVKDSIRFVRKDSTVVVLSEQKVVDFDFTDSRRFANVYFVAKGVSDTAMVTFLSFPNYQQLGTVFHVKADSGHVAVRFVGSQGFNAKGLYLLKAGQRAEVRALYDAVAQTELWEVVVLWDSIPLAPILTGTARTIPFFNNSGALIYNPFFKLDSTITSGAQAKYRLLINNPNGTAGEGDSYSAISVRAGDGSGTEAIFNIGDQAATMGTTGYNAVFQLYRARGTFESKANLLNGDNIGNFSWRGQANGGSRALGSIALTYTGDGNTYRSQMLGQTSTAAGQNQSGWKLDDQSRFWLGAGADDYFFPTTAPSSTANRRTALYWEGTGSGNIPVFKDRLVYGDGPFSIPAGGIYTVTLPFTMSSNFYNVLITLKDNGGDGTNLTYQIIDQTATTFKLKFFVANTGLAATGGNYSIYYKLEDF